MRIPLAIFAALPVAAFAVVNVNTAQQSELERVKGIDRAKAKSIIEWRAKNGSIGTLAELRQVPGFTPDLIEKVKPEIAFNGAAYVGKPKPKAEKKPAPPTLARGATD